SGALPFTACDQLERTGGDFSTSLGHTNNDGLAPTAVAALQRLTHHLGVADTFKGVIRTAVCQLNDVVHHVFNFIGVHEIGHAELASHGFALGVDIHANDLASADHLGALYHVQANTAQTEDHHIGTRFHFGGEQHSAQACGHATADVAHLVER